VQLESAAGWSQCRTSKDEKAEEQKEKKETAFLFLAPQEKAEREARLAQSLAR
jgi:hypothetical protein